MSTDAHDLVSALAACRKAIQLYPATHPNHSEAVSALVDTVRELSQQGQFVLNVHQGRLYDGSTMIGTESPGEEAVAEAMESRRVESLTFHPGFGESDARGLAEVLNLRSSGEFDVEAELTSRGVGSVTVSSLVDDDVEAKEERDRRKEQDRALYRQLLAVMRTISLKLMQGETASASEADPMVRGILGRLLEDRSAMLGLATMSSRNETDLYHGINVMIYSLTLGTLLGLPEDGLASLGVSALLHDVGKTAFDAADASQAQAMHLLHPSVGADILARLPDDDRSPMLVAYEHHMGSGGGGHPDRPDDYIPHPYSRMVAIANRYDNLTKPSEGPGLTPDRAVKQLLAEAGGPLDPLFVRLFVKALGVFPIGCAVRLSDDSVALVCDNGDDPMSPKIRVLFDDRGIALENPEDVEIQGDNRVIVEVVEAESLRLEVSEHL